MRELEWDFVLINGGLFSYKVNICGWDNILCKGEYLFGKIFDWWCYFLIRSDDCVFVFMEWLIFEMKLLNLFG